jgi:integrase
VLVDDEATRVDVRNAEPSLAKVTGDMLGPEVVRVEPTVERPEEPAADLNVGAPARIAAQIGKAGVGRVFRTRSIRTAFENAVEGAGLEDLHFHDCRHHFASWFVMRGGSLQALKEILGHATLAMTMRYAHLAPEHLRAEVAKTERRAEPASDLAQASTQEPVALVGVSSN